LDSILGQSHADFELIISDNGSTDATEPICREFARRDHRIRYFRHDINRGASWNHNQVVHLAHGPLFRWASYDDLCAPELLERCVAVLESHPRLILCYSKSKLIDENGLVVGNYDVPFATDSPRPHERFYDLISRVFLCNQFYGVIRTAALRKTRLLGDFLSADIHLLAELSLHGPFFEIPEYLFYRRDHPLRSVRANPSPRDLLAWFNPGAKDSFRFTKIKRAFAYSQAIQRSPLPAEEKLRCYRRLAAWMLGRAFSFMRFSHTPGALVRRLAGGWEIPSFIPLQMRFFRGDAGRSRRGIGQRG
jgi:glycosyltransferase involved in cell wall biosynthesis